MTDDPPPVLEGQTCIFECGMAQPCRGCTWDTEPPKGPQ